MSKAKENGQGRANSEPVDERGVGGVIEETVVSIRASALLLKSCVRKEEGLPLGADESKLDGLVVQRDDSRARPLVERVLLGAVHVVELCLTNPYDRCVVWKGKGGGSDLS